MRKAMLKIWGRSIHLTLPTSRINENEMINLLKENIEMKSQRTNSTFAIRTSQRPNPKLQKSYFFHP